MVTKNVFGSIAMEKSGRWEGPGLARTASVSLSLGAVLREPNFWTSHSGGICGLQSMLGRHRMGAYQLGKGGSLCSHVSCRKLSHQGEKYLIVTSLSTSGG